MPERITHPTTGKTLAVDTFPVVPRELLAWTKTRPNCTAKDISWHLLSQRRSLAKMTAQDGGDARHNNYGLRVFEHGLDWSLGLAVLRLLAACSEGKLPKPFMLLATRNGAVLARLASGKIVELLA